MGWFARSGLFVLMLSTQVPGAYGQAPPQALELYDEAKADLAAGNPTPALVKFKRGIVLAGGDVITGWRMILGAALACEKMGQPIMAIDYYRRFVASFDRYPGAAEARWRDRRELVVEMITTLETSILANGGIVELSSEPPGARVLVEGSPWGLERDAVTPTRLFLKPGTWRIQLELADYEPVERAVQVAIGARLPLAVDLKVDRPQGTLEVEWPKPVLVVEKKPEPAPAAPPTPLKKRASGSSAKVWGWIVAGTGVGVALVGVPFSIMAGNDQQSMKDLDPYETGYNKKYDDLDATRGRNVTLSLVMYGVGGAAIAGGVVTLLLSADWDSGATKTSGDFDLRVPTVGLFPLDDGAVISAGWRW
jgi:hypothetical protein